MKIFKYEITVGPGEAPLELPEGAKILSVQEQKGWVVLWAEVDPGRLLKPSGLIMIYTGSDVPGDARYLATVQSGGLVFHFYVKNS